MIINRLDAEDAAALLELWNIDQPKVELADMTPEIINEQYRRAARRCHPDLGGKPQEFVAVDRAKHVLLGWLARQPEAAAKALQPRRCPDCEGKGYIKRHRGFTAALRVQCAKCKGHGELDVEEEKTNT